MIVVFADYEVPVAYSMVETARQAMGQSPHPIQLFTCYWAAFNNIYVTIAEQKGRRAQLRRNADGSIRTRMVGPISVPEVDPVSEREQIDLAFGQFTADLKRSLVEHPSTQFFVYRTPRWRGKPIVSDGQGQRLNGALNVGHTVDASCPVWTPIDTAMYEEYEGDVARRDPLARQILDVLYTVRNNTFHGGKRTDDANDREVLERSLPLLMMIVQSFVEDRQAA